MIATIGEARVSERPHSSPLRVLVIFPLFLFVILFSSPDVNIARLASKGIVMASRIDSWGRGGGVGGSFLRAGQNACDFNSTICRCL